MVKRNNYTHNKSHWGGVPGTIQMHTVSGLGVNNDPTTAKFKENMPAGFLKCDGTIKNSKDFLLLSQILGVGDESRFKKENAILRNIDTETNDLGQFQLPDLGSKVIIGSRGSGEYFSTTLEDDEGVSKVGVEVDPISNIGNTATVNYIGNMLIGSDIANFNSSPKYTVPKDTSLYSLTIDEFQGHYHNVAGDTGFTVLNYSAAHDIGGDGKGPRANTANASAGNTLEETSISIPSGESGHDHTITRPFTYTHDFTYSHSNIDVPLDDMSSTVNVDVENLNVLNQVVTPFILVHYIIKF
jgi:hypothetical protein